MREVPYRVMQAFLPMCKDHEIQDPEKLEPLCKPLHKPVHLPPLAHGITTHVTM